MANESKPLPERVSVAKLGDLGSTLAKAGLVLVDGGLRYAREDGKEPTAEDETNVRAHLIGWAIDEDEKALRQVP